MSMTEDSVQGQGAAERFDIFDEHMHKIGTAARHEVHRQGYWHQTFHCWVLSPSAEGGWRLLVQKRHPDKDTFPNLLDISCAGHLCTGEGVEDGVRELQEELGLTVPFRALYSCGVFPEELVIPGELIDREFSHIFLHRDDRPLKDYTFQRSEITGLFVVDLNDFRGLVEGIRETVPACGIEVVGKLGTDATKDATEGLVEFEKELTLADFCPHDRTYYEFLFQHMEKFVAGQGK